MEENLENQIDEIEALTAIYPDEWVVEDESYRTYKAVITESGKTATLLLTLPPEYPRGGPPLYLLTAPWMTSSDYGELCEQLEEIYINNIGESILHLWIEKLREFLQVKIPVCTPVEEASESEPEQRFDDDINLEEECPEITSATPFCDRKSTFQGHAATVTRPEQVKLVLAKLYENRKIAQATHNIYAYRIYNEDSKMWLQDCEDDGESQAGGRLMHLLQILEVKNVLVVVSRWFGGILLGGDRFKHINNAARQVLEQSLMLPSSTRKDSVEESKKKTKKCK